MSNIVENLITALLDNTGREDERDDAAMDLGLYNDLRSLYALTQVATNPDENTTVLDSCGESIAKILILQNKYDKELLNKLSHSAKNTALSYIHEAKPEWINTCD